MPDHVRRATPDDAEAVAALIGEVFPANPKADPAVLRWQYWDNPFGAPSSWVVEDAGRLVGPLHRVRAARPHVGRAGDVPEVR